MRVTTAVCASSANGRITDASCVTSDATAAMGRRFHWCLRCDGASLTDGIFQKPIGWAVSCRSWREKGRQKRKRAFPEESPFKVARLAGFEPTTPWFVAKYSIQLSYSRTQSGTTSTVGAFYGGKAPKKVARLAGFEPTTPWFVAKYSIQLSYSRTQN